MGKCRDLSSFVVVQMFEEAKEQKKGSGGNIQSRIRTMENLLA